jgi:hypothetical protein
MSLSGVSLFDGDHRAHHEGFQHTSGLVVNVRAFGAVGDGVTDDTAAIQDAIDYIVTNQQTTASGSLFFPSSSYKVTSTFDLTGLNTAFHFLGGNRAGGLNSHQMPPATRIDGRTITTGPVFYYDGNGSTANHHYERLSVLAGRTGWHYEHTADMHFTNCGGSVIEDGHADNAPVLMNNSFWGWFDYCAFTAPDGDKPSVILRGSSPVVNAQASGLMRFANCTFKSGGIAIEQNVNANEVGNVFILNSIVEDSEGQPLLDIIEGGTVDTAYPIIGIMV